MPPVYNSDGEAEADDVADTAQLTTNGRTLSGSCATADSSQSAVAANVQYNVGRYSGKVQDTEPQQKRKKNDERGKTMKFKRNRIIDSDTSDDTVNGKQLYATGIICITDSNP